MAWGYNERWDTLDTLSGAAKGGALTMGSPFAMTVGGVFGKKEGSGLRPFGQPKTAASADPNRFGIDRGAKDYAARTQAALLRADWDYARGELNPLLDRLLYTYQNPNGEQESIQTSQAAATEGFDRGQRSVELNMRRAGLALTPEQRAAFDQVSSLQRGLASTSGANTGARQHAELKDQIAAGSSGLTTPNTVQPKLTFGQ